MTTLRLYLIHQRVIKPRNLKETRQAFPFPYKPRENRVRWIGLSRHVEAMHWMGK